MPGCDLNAPLWNCMIRAQEFIVGLRFFTLWRFFDIGALDTLITSFFLGPGKACKDTLRS